MECTAAERELIERVVEWATIPDDDDGDQSGFFWMFRKYKRSPLVRRRFEAQAAFRRAGRAVVAERSN